MTQFHITDTCHITQRPYNLSFSRENSLLCPHFHPHPSSTIDTFLHTPTSMAKRPYPYPYSYSLTSSQNSKLPTKQTQMDHVLESFLSLADSPSLSVDLAFDRLLESLPSDADQCQLIDRALKVGSLLLQAANRSSRKRASQHNALVWPLPHDLTIKVFSTLDSQGLCYVGATCSMFNTCAMDPLCYANIDLTTAIPMVNNAVVSTMIQRAGKTIQSLKLGIVHSKIETVAPRGQSSLFTIKNYMSVSNFSWNDKKTRQGRESSILTRSCLNPLRGDDGAVGNLLTRLHLYNIERMDNASLCVALSACPHLLDLEIVGLQVELTQTLVSVSMNCHLMERLFFESSKTARDGSLKYQTCADLVNSCPNLTSLALRGSKLSDNKVRMLVKGFRNLKYVDLSTSYPITGKFLRNLGSNTGGSILEVLILRDCMHLEEVEVARFLTAVLAGDFQFLRHIDISNKEGLASEGGWYRRFFNSSLIPLKQVMEERPGIRLLVEFPSEGSFMDDEHMIDSELNSGEVTLSSHSSDGSFFASPIATSNNSDKGSGNGEATDSGYALYEENSDGVDFVVL